MSMLEWAKGQLGKRSSRKAQSPYVIIIGFYESQRVRKDTEADDTLCGINGLFFIPGALLVAGREQSYELR